MSLLPTWPHLAMGVLRGPGLQYSYTSEVTTDEYGRRRTPKEGQEVCNPLCSPSQGSYSGWQNSFPGPTLTCGEVR